MHFAKQVVLAKLVVLSANQANSGRTFNWLKDFTQLKIRQMSINPNVADLCRA
jgi:hypothetical protein